ncbi:hypothetical protein [Corynebacterium callunae]|uniref:Uncharacterized protein n=1 Tax=Corynebacterium callunae DSM 20147 TaxID=1121353 RepID=M1UGH6_9CORY|nr:hypothetical protein [Corynebacterium callunae]AGG67375.1 hypothetical protein H924_09685 [Corynebacterium callunae DSM 20147]MCK2199309.1 hypothetical protein [Corynebacterium callunae]
MTAFLDWITQHLTTAPLWIQSPLVIMASVLVCALLAVPLLRVIDLAGAAALRIFHREQPQQPIASRKEN